MISEMLKFNDFLILSMSYNNEILILCKITTKFSCEI